jgi:hypothetical protein
VFSFAWVFGGRRETPSHPSSHAAYSTKDVVAKKEASEISEKPPKEKSPPTSTNTEVDLKGYSKEEISFCLKGLSNWIYSKKLEELFPGQAEEIGPKFLNNPGFNCFMNAGFQSFFINAERLSWVRGCLNSIMEAEISKVCPFDNATAYWRENQAPLESDCKQELKSQPGMECLKMTFKEAAAEMLNFLDKWEKEGLSGDEGKELRKLSLILASYQGNEMYRVFCLSEQEITIGGMSLSCLRQEDSAEFMTRFIESLHELSPDTEGFESLELQTTTVLSDGEKRKESPISVTNIFVSKEEVDLAGGFLETYGNSFKEGEAQVGTKIKITHFPQFLRMTVGLFRMIVEPVPKEEKVFPNRYQFNGSSPYELVIQGNHYQLDSFVVHQGTTVKSGHYYTYARGIIEGRPSWVKYNDGHISPVEDAEVENLFNGRSDSVTPYDLMFSKVLPMGPRVDLSILSDPSKSPAPLGEGA